MIDLPNPPTPSEVLESRGPRSQTAMATALGLGSRQRIGEYESGERNMPAVVWAYWLLVSGQHPTHQISARKR